jgi:tryptophan-rich sensory protein
MSDWQTYYAALSKPSWTPPPSTIGLIWNILYSIIVGSIVFVWVKVAHGQMPRHVLYVFLGSFLLNLLFTPVQFGLRSLWGSSVIIVLLLASIPVCMYVVWPYSRAVAFAQIPYLLWVATATYLQISITLLNR